MMEKTASLVSDGLPSAASLTLIRHCDETAFGTAQLNVHSSVPAKTMGFSAIRDAAGDLERVIYHGG